MARTFSIRRATLAILASTAWLSAHALAVELIGYVPNYRLGAPTYANTTLPNQLTLLDEVRYFGLSVDSEANLTTTDEDLTHLRSIKSNIDRLPAAERPRLGITLGGWGKSTGFLTVAASEELRVKFAKNLAALLDRTGATAVDLDWEHPAAGKESNQHYPALLTRIKQAVGPDRRVYATLEPSTFIAPSALAGPHAIDGVSLMTYDLNWWSNAEGRPALGPHSSQADVEDSVRAWTDRPGTTNPRPAVFAAWGLGVRPGALGVGLPFYGRAVGDSDPKHSASYRDLVANGKTDDGNLYRFRDADYWIPSLADVRNRVAAAESSGLQQIILWELAQDLPPSDERSMLRAAHAARRR